MSGLMMAANPESETHPMALSKMDIAALRKADSVCFDHLPDAIGRIRAIKEHGRTERDPFAQDVTHAIDVDSGVAGHAYGHNIDFTAFAMVYAYDRTWSTITALLRVGDELSLVWVADNNNGYVEAADLHVDELQLIVKRGGKALTFHVDHSVCADNTARMIRRRQYSLT